MPGAGKSTIGQILAKMFDYAFVDTDLILEALYARPLQKVTDMLSREAFLDAEAEVVCSLNARDCVIATGGSVIYRQKAMQWLKRLGPVIYLNPPLEIIVERVSRKPDRGISFGPGQSLEDIHAERTALYETCADVIYDSSTAGASKCAEKIAEMLGKKQEAV